MCVCVCVLSFFMYFGSPGWAYLLRRRRQRRQHAAPEPEGVHIFAYGGVRKLRRKSFALDASSGLLATLRRFGANPVSVCAQLVWCELYVV